MCVIVCACMCVRVCVCECGVCMSLCEICFFVHLISYLHVVQGTKAIISVIV